MSKGAAAHSPEVKQKKAIGSKLSATRFDRFDCAQHDLAAAASKNLMAVSGLNICRKYSASSSEYPKYVEQFETRPLKTLLIRSDHVYIPKLAWS